MNIPPRTAASHLRAGGTGLAQAPRAAWDWPQLVVLIGFSCHSTMNTKLLFLGKHYLIGI